MEAVREVFGKVGNYIADSSEKAALRGEVAFERWYYHYQPESATKELGQLSSRAWALAYTIESVVKAIIVMFSILAYAYVENKLEIERRCEVLKTQGSSLLYSACAIAMPEIVRDAFKEANTVEEIAKRTFSLGSRYTLYRGDITLKMLINTH